jgi:hypothetical protein
MGKNMRYAMLLAALMASGAAPFAEAAALPCNQGPAVISGTVTKRTVERQPNGQQRTRFTLANPTCGDRPIDVTIQGALACSDGARVMVRGQFSAANPNAPVMGPAAAICSGGAVGG